VKRWLSQLSANLRVSTPTVNCVTANAGAGAAGCGEPDATSEATRFLGARCRARRSTPGMTGEAQKKTPGGRAGGR